jgi:hypothetical protein
VCSGSGLQEAVCVQKAVLLSITHSNYRINRIVNHIIYLKLGVRLSVTFHYDKPTRWTFSCSIN